MHTRLAAFSTLILLSAGVTVAGCSGADTQTDLTQDATVDAVGTASLPLQASVDGQIYRLARAKFTFTSVDDPTFVPRE